MEVDNILNSIPDKRQNRNTTSLVFKKDLIEFFGDKYLDKKCYEIGTHTGYSTRLLSFLFKKVKTIDSTQQRIDGAKKFNKDRNNIEYICGDVYKKNVVIESNNWWTEEKIVKEKFDVVFIDCIHDTEHVLKDIETAIREGTDDVIVIFDDYGLFPEVKKAIDDCIDSGVIKVLKYIGQPSGTVYPETINKVLKDREGIICQKKI